MPQTRRNRSGEALELKLPASLQALADQAKQMLKQIDAEKARCYVQQVANGHSDQDEWGTGPDGPTSYKERMQFLERSEKNLRDHLPRAVIKALDKEQT